MVIHNSIPNASAVLVRRELFQRAIRGAETRRLSGDWWTWVRMLLEADIAFVAEPLNYFRVHEYSVRDTTRRTVSCAEEFSLKAYICSQIPVAQKMRRRAFREQYSKWREIVRDPAFDWNKNWLKTVHRDARKIWPTATLRMAWGIARAKVEQSLKAR